MPISRTSDFIFYVHGGAKVIALRYSVLLAKRDVDSQILLDKTGELLRNYDAKLNKKKTKVLLCGKLDKKKKIGPDRNINREPIGRVEYNKHKIKDIF